MNGDGYTVATSPSQTAPTFEITNHDTSQRHRNGDATATKPLFRLTPADPDQRWHGRADARRGSGPETSPAGSPLAVSRTSKVVSRNRHKQQNKAEEERDSGIGATSSTASNGLSLSNDGNDGDGDGDGCDYHNRYQSIAGSSEADVRLSTSIPSGSLFGDELLDHMTFSKRGSILLGGRRADRSQNGHLRRDSCQRRQSLPVLSPVECERECERVLSADEEFLSRQVRSLYGHANGSHGSGQSATPPPLAQSPAPRAELSLETAGQPSPHTLSHEQHDGQLSPLAFSSDASGRSRPKRLHPAIDPDEDDRGGLEDWEDLEAGDVDRYGFIISRKLSARVSSTNPNKSLRTFEHQRPQRVSTLLQLATETPRKDRSLGWRAGSPKTTRSVTPQSRTRQPSEQSFGASSPVTSGRSSSPWTLPARPFRYAANLLQGTKSKRILAEAGDMLTMPPSLADAMENGDAARRPPLSKEKEKESARADKWLKMARVVNGVADGRGMLFDFDVHDPKVRIDPPLPATSAFLPPYVTGDERLLGEGPER